MQTQPIPEITPEDIQQNKVMAALAYIIFFLPLLAAKESKFARYHANQGLVLLLTGIAIGIVGGILTGIFTAIALSTGSIAMMGIISTLLMLVNIALCVLGIMGIVNGATGKVKPLPLIGGISIIK